MLDTIRLSSPPIDEVTAEAVESRVKTRTCVDNRTGVQDYNLVGGQLQGSWDTSIMVSVERSRWCSVVCVDTGRSYAQRVPCEPYVVVEGSVHKALMGHNVAGGPVDFVAAARWFLFEVQARLGIALPFVDGWVVERVDVAEVYDLGEFEACEEFMRGLRLARFPRRQPATYGFECVYFPGRSTTVKVYHKGPEFAKRDYKRLRDGAVWYLEPGPLAALQGEANRYLRVEVEIRGPKLRYDFGHLPKVTEVTISYLEQVHDVETMRVVREGSDDMKTVRRNEEVSKRLQVLYGLHLGNTLFGTWSRLVMVGEQEVRRTMTRPTFYRHRKQLEDAKCSWVGTDVFVLGVVSKVPDDFAPVRSDPRRVKGIAPEVVEQLQVFAAA